MSKQSPSARNVWLFAYLNRPVCEPEQVELLQDALAAAPPGPDQEVLVARSATERKRVRVPLRGDLLQTILGVAPPMGFSRLRHWCILAAGQRVGCYCDSSEVLATPGNNKIAIEIKGTRPLEGLATAAWARIVFEALCRGSAVYYGWAASNEESSESRPDDAPTADGPSAGLYWLNYFGEPTTRLVGKRALLAAPALEAKPVGNGVLLATAEAPEDWRTEESRARAQAIIQHVGPQLFGGLDLTQPAVAADPTAHRPAPSRRRGALRRPRGQGSSPHDR
jgi:hypothetical protein